MLEDLQQKLNIEQLVTQFVGFLPNLVVAILMFIGFWVIYRVTHRSLEHVMRRAGFDNVLIQLLVNKLYKFAVLTFGLVMAASQVGINVGAALAGIGVMGIALGFAAQEFLANIIAGFVIFWDKPFVVGDYIDTNDERGVVKNITLRSTRIKTNQNNYVVIPNKKIIDDPVINFSKHGSTRVDIPVGIAYKEDIGKARSVLLEAVGGLDMILKDPEPTVVVKDLGGSSVDLLVRVWIDHAEKERPTYFAVAEQSKVSLDEAGIEIPFPHLQLFVDNVEDRVWKGLKEIPQLAKPNSN
ncbi:MAG: mechanosensitive ion channel family protein [Candidatus Eisenbacteria bacterium]|uniref:Mechanosensitive ion channel family protein n=1 Tax=Eiseniibacteriota bacterium TaxID=2212470 RepID=A0A7Y2H4B1_UNCEI|nr:mechanosensitive ion channel family protein [Candidatus Eisenbacteria bacterium]